MARYDIYVQIIPADQYTGTKFMSFGQKRTVGVRGMQKLVNMFTIALLTPIGSDPLDLERGTDIPNLIGSNVNTADAYEILQLGIDKAVADLGDYQAGKTIPNDERLSRATLTDFLVIEEAPGFAAQIYVENIVSQGLTFLLPTLEVRT